VKECDEGFILTETSGNTDGRFGKQRREHIRCTPISVVIYEITFSQTVGLWEHVNARGCIHPTAAADSC